MKIRQATRDDAAAIARVHVDSSRTTYAHLLPQSFLSGLSYDEREALWARALADANRKSFTFVAEHPSAGIVGFAMGGPERSGITGYSGELMAIYLTRAAQRQGIGRRLVSAVAGRLAASGHESMMVWVLADNPSRGFYETLGGEAIAEKLVEIAGIQLVEAALGWKDLGGLKEVPPDACNGSGYFRK
ncbi:MAG TPA: GNAT family N-acetyltransferase [Planctomycetaceae bacterium]